MDPDAAAPALPDSDPYVVPGQEFAVTVHVNNPGDAPLEIKRMWIETPAGENWTAAPDGPVPARLNAGQALDQRFRIRVPENAAPTRPYFSAARATRSRTTTWPTRVIKTFPCRPIR